MRQLLFLTGFLFITGACAPARFVEPLDKGQWSAGGNLGGPLIEYPPAVIPLPFVAAEVGYGVDTNLTVHGGLNVTSLLFGNLHLDAGITYKFLNQKKYIPNLSVSPSFQMVFDVYDKAGKFWPVLDLNAYWNYGKRRNYFYTGINNYFELSSTMANDQPQAHHWLFSPQIGHVLKGKNQKFQFTTEFKFLGINLNSKYSFIPYSGLLGDMGSTGVYLGFRWFINK
jgi:hypothetical protein